jgi:hypothetical protein
MLYFARAFGVLHRIGLLRVEDTNGEEGSFLAALSFDRSRLASPLEQLGDDELQPKRDTRVYEFRLVCAKLDPYSVTGL